MTFQLDQSPGFYGFVFSYDGTCVAHGADDSFVGLSLKQVRVRVRVRDRVRVAVRVGVRVRVRVRVRATAHL